MHPPTPAAGPLDEVVLRGLVPQVIGILVRRGNDFAAAEDAVQDALFEAVRSWPAHPPDNPRAWLIGVASRRLVDAARSDASRRAREQRVEAEPPPGSPTTHDDTLRLLFLCCHPSLAPASAIALTLRAVGGLTTDQIAEAFLVPRATMAQRITRAKRTVEGVRLDSVGDLSLVLRVLYLIHHAGHATGPSAGHSAGPSTAPVARTDLDLGAEAIRLTRQLAREVDDPEVLGLLALMLLTHARRGARFDDQGRIVPLDEQDRTLWHTGEIAEGVTIVQTALACGRRGEYQLQAAIAALHDDAASAAETDWPQILEWYDELVSLTGNPIARLSRSVGVAHAMGPLAALADLDDLAASDPALTERHRYLAVRAYLMAMADRPAEAADLYGLAATRTTSTAERDHLTRQAARLRTRQ